MSELGNYADLAFWVLTLGVVPFWWAAKKLAVELDDATIWDGADLAFGMVVGVVWFVFFLVAPPFERGAIEPAFVAIRRGAMGVWTGTMCFWFASIELEAGTAVDVPESMLPIRYRFYHQMRWMPGIEPRGDEPDYCEECRSTRLEEVGIAADGGGELGKLCRACGRMQK